MLRINPDRGPIGQAHTTLIPTDNPFYGTATGNNRLIYALGLRNPFTFAFNPVQTRLFINDVGQNTWEEINDGVAGANYGWPNTEGNTNEYGIRQPAVCLRSLGRLCHHWRSVLCTANSAVSVGLPQRLFLRRLLWRLDPQARSRNRQR